MQNTIKIQEDLFWVGANNRKLSLFESVYPVLNGVSYNSYLLLDEKTVLFDTVDKSVSDEFFENIDYALSGRNLDYLVINHMEPDHCSQISNIVDKYKTLTIICNKKAEAMIKNFFNLSDDVKFLIVAEGDTLNTGKHNLNFVFAPMVHWPEVMVTYDSTDKILFSADAFGTFGAIEGNIFADEVDFEARYMDEARRYYTNIVGKYGNQVQALLKKASTIDIKMICPLHGFVWRKNIASYIEKYILWATYTPEIKSVLIVYGSIYGNTKQAAEILSNKLSCLGVKNIRMFDVSMVHPSYIISEVFRYSHIVLLSPTYNAEVFVNMETLVRNIVSHNIQKRTFALVENGSWAPTSGSIMYNTLSKIKNTKVLEPKITINSALKEENEIQLENLAKILSSDIVPQVSSEPHPQIEKDSIFSISYGLYVLSSKYENKDNACIINTVQQVTDNPLQISITVNKANYTNEMIQKSGKFNVSVLTTDTPFSLIKTFGFQSGRTNNKFSESQDRKRSENGLYFITNNTNAYYSAKVRQTIDLGTHTMFIGEITEAKNLSGVASLTYDYYFKHIKPNPNNILETKKGWVCKICGYVYEGGDLPDDFICPLCKHGASDFEKLQ